MKRFAAISDLHGELPQTPKCDFLVIPGDICPTENHGVGFQKKWYEETFVKWLEEQPATYKIFIAGNHDFYFEHMPNQWVRKFLGKNCYYLKDDSVTLEGVKFYGTPWQPIFYDWAFNLTEKGLADKFASIPYDVDVLISHGPPYNFGQTDVITEKCVYADGSHLGSISLADAITRTRPKYVVFGHIHSGDHTPYERHIDNDKIIAVNVSRLDERYYPVYDIPIFDLP